MNPLKLARIRYEIAQRVSRLLLGRMASRLPMGSVRTVEEAVHKPHVARHVEAIERVSDPVTVSFPFPESFPPNFRRTKVFDRRYLYVLRDVIASPHSGLIWTREGNVFEESVGVIVRIMGWGGNVPELLLPQEDAPAGRVYMVCPAVPFYHFYWEILPVMVQALDRHPDLHFISPGKLPAYTQAALRELLGAGWQARMHRTEKACRVGRLVMPQVEVYSGFIHPEYVRILRRAAAHWLANNQLKPDGPERIYLSRRLTPSRAMEGEQELEEALASLGFTTIFAEKLSLLEQLRLFSGARVVVSPHGAGLSHIGLMVDTPTVVELFPYNFFNDCYARLTLMMGGSYRYLTCPEGTPGRSRIDLDATLAAVHEALAATQPSTPAR